jgi:hypothetical protein
MKITKALIMLIALIFIYISPIFSLSILDKPLTDPFESEVELKNFDRLDHLSDADNQYLDNSSISLLTKDPGKDIYSWFGHTSILIETPQSSIIYDYGVFSFDSDNFYTNFLQGKMYYLLYVSYLDQSLTISKSQERSVDIIKLEINNEQKASIINFLNYNSQDSNRTYLYDFYKDNCATRIRDIFNWITEDDFKTWAQNKKSTGTFRELANRSLSKNPLIFWCLNSLQGQAADEVGSVWDDMYLPTHLQMAVRNYEKLGNTELSLYKSEIAPPPVENENNNHILLYSIFSLIISLVALAFKRAKQIRNSKIYGIFNIIILSFLLIITSAIFFLSFFSSINAAWYNENLVFLNPLTIIMMMILAIRILSKKKEPLKKIIQFERGSRWYAHIIFVLFILKLIFSATLFQNNLNIMLPIWIYFITQGTMLRSKK